MGHFTRAKVEDFVRKNTTSWGTQEMHIQMNWGYRGLLRASVVALSVPSDSRLHYQHQAQANRTSQPALVRKKSPPLGIPLAALDSMGDEYRRYVHEIVTNDLDSYVPTAYSQQDWDLPKHLLEAISSFYRAGLAAGQEVIYTLSPYVSCMLTFVVRDSGRSPRGPRYLHDPRTESRPRRAIDVRGREPSRRKVSSTIGGKLRAEAG